MNIVIDNPTAGASKLTFDLETDNSEGHGLNPGKAGITEFAARAAGDDVVIAHESERQLLSEAVEFINDYADEVDYLQTWNGSGFDLPFLQKRLDLHNITSGLSIVHNPDLKPKYPSDFIEGCFDGTWTVGDKTLGHVDVQWMYRDVCHTIALSRGESLDAAGALKKYWSLKPMCGALGFHMHVEDRMNLHLISAERRAKYALSDVYGTDFLGSRTEVTPAAVA